MLFFNLYVYMSLEYVKCVGVFCYLYVFFKFE